MNTLSNFKVFQNACSCILIAGMSAVLGASVDAQLVDDFEGTLSGYTSTVILDNNGGSSNTATWGITNGELGLTTTAYDNIEQYAYIRDGLSLAVGQEVQLDMTAPLPSDLRNFGLYVGGTAPITSTGNADMGGDFRQDFISVYGETGSAVIRSRGFDGTTEYDNPGAVPEFGDGILEGPVTVFIARSADNVFDVGFYFDDARTVFTTREPSTANTADFVGLYADVREAGTIGFGDNLTIGSIPTTLLGDFDMDGDVDLTDLDQYIGNIGAPAAGGMEALDLNDDGTVGADDFAQHYSDLVETSNGQTGTFAGDANLDGIVDVLGDAASLIDNLNMAATSWGQGDFNGDGTVDVLGDAAALVDNLGATNNPAAGPATSAVPEPGSLSLLALAGIAATIGRRR